MSYNGMYILSEWVHNDKCVFTKNEQYYDADSCKLDTWTGIMLTDASAQVNAFEAGQLDMTALTGEQVTAMESTYPGVNIESYADGSVWALMFNMQDDIMSNFYIRKALAECVDRASFITNVRKDQSEVYMHWTYGNLSINGKKFSDVWTENTAFNDADTEAAAEDWAKGCEELGISTDTVLEYLTDDGESAKLYAEYVQGCAASAGITLTIKAVPFKERLANQTAGTYQMSMYGWGQDYDDPQTFLDLWVTGGGNNKAFFSDAEYDSLVEIMNTSTDADEREAACIRAEEIIDEQIVVAPIYSRRTSYVVSAKLGGMVRTVQQDWSLRFAYINE
jgi:oligopeptide transport system substrate-binding protein